MTLLRFIAAEYADTLRDALRCGWTRARNRRGWPWRRTGVEPC